MFPKRQTPLKSSDAIIRAQPSPSSSNHVNSPNHVNSASPNNHFNHHKSSSLDEEIEYFSPNLNGSSSTINLAPSPIKNDYRKDPQLSRTTKDGVRSPSLFTKYPSMDAVLGNEETSTQTIHPNNNNNSKTESEIYEKLFEDDSENISTPIKSGNQYTTNKLQTSHSLDVMITQETTTTPKTPLTNSFTNNVQSSQSSSSVFPKSTNNSSSPFPKVNASNRRRTETTMEHFSTPNAEKLHLQQSSSSPSMLMQTSHTNNDTMDVSDFEQFNADNMLKPLKASTTKQLQQLQNSGETVLNDTTMITRQESKHQALFHHYLEEKGDMRSAMLLLNQFHVKQHRMNILNFKLNSINLVANFANAVKSHKLQLELHKSKKTVNALNSKVEELNETVTDLNEEVEQHKSSLSSFIQKYYKTVEELQQHQLIQKTQLENIMKLKTREDITVDLLILIASSYIVRKNRTLHRLLKFVFMFLPFNGLVILIVKILTTIGLMLISRRVAIRLGIHAGATSIAYGAIKSVQFSLHVLKTLWSLFNSGHRDGNSLKKE
ncbi:hypothetical protein C9374_004098 [Naegleria lovaniensis]|uniref:Uncharacterized protein n=1 Tax=Naegleria lovaniensis TaxID=51637 RepID=A0AA88GRV2_NAELO|nr:uncharacterized protein C9374_004098 [Naegleria lovaniensis]KAG2383427.1 hypothetical protein C9374_004098 [Naegleria lovaniensis]